MFESLGAALLDSAVVFRLALGPANKLQLVLTKKIRTKAATWVRLSVAII